ncbi:MAG TPA: hypothetical protein VF176_03585 [Solirubrobacterales bacterium]
MAESVKRRVAAARLAVAFVAAGTIAGATAWAQAGPPPAPTAQSSAFDSFLKIDGIKGENIVDGSLLFKDFKKHQVPSYKQFQKVEISQRAFKKAVLGRYYPKVEIDKLFIKGESTDYIKRSEISDYIKHSEADASYIKLGDAIMGDGSVFTASKLVDSQTPTPLLDVQSMFTVDAMGPTIRITNTSGGELGHSSCPTAQGSVPAGSLQPGEHIDCFANDSTESIQFFSWGELKASATVSFSSVAKPGTPSMQDTVQILIGL